MTHDGSRYTKILMLFSVPGKKERRNGSISVSETYLRPPSELEFRLIFHESAWEATGAIFARMCLIPLYRPFYEKLV